MGSIDDEISKLAIKYADNLKKAIDNRSKEMKSDDNSHYLIYRVLGILDNEGRLIDEYQNKGRFLYKYAGSFLEEATILCFEHKHNNAKRKVLIPNTQGLRTKTFEIDCLISSKAYEIKWRDATTDGDHITKEHTRLKQIKKAGYTPIHIMFYYPNRSQAIKYNKLLRLFIMALAVNIFMVIALGNILKPKQALTCLSCLKI
jgi:type II restriction enzyme